MKVRSICLSKNEADVLGACLAEAARWSHRIYIFDGASTDGTWEAAQALADECIVPWRSDGTVFREGLRALVFAAFRHEAVEGDWWCQLNADEFYTEDVRAFLAAVPAHEHVVYGVNVQYYVTPEDVAEISGDFARDRDRLRYYRAAITEPRFFRHRRGLRWRETDAWPQHLGLVHRRLLPFSHYPYRSPRQMQMRLDVRRDNRARGFEGWDHAKELDWREKLVARGELHFDAQDGRLIIEEEIQRQHLEPLGRRWCKRLLHGTGLWP